MHGAAPRGVGLPAFHFHTPEEAEKVSRDTLDLGGATHQHEVDGELVYAPGQSHAALQRAARSAGYKAPPKPGQQQSSQQGQGMGMDLAPSSEEAMFGELTGGYDKDAKAERDLFY